jgi:hypothetical protein
MDTRVAARCATSQDKIQGSSWNSCGKDGGNWQSTWKTGTELKALHLAAFEIIVGADDREFTAIGAAA